MTYYVILLGEISKHRMQYFNTLYNTGILWNKEISGFLVDPVKN